MIKAKFEHNCILVTYRGKSFCLDFRSHIHVCDGACYFGDIITAHYEKLKPPRPFAGGRRVRVRIIGSRLYLQVLTYGSGQLPLMELVESGKTFYNVICQPSVQPVEDVKIILRPWEDFINFLISTKLFSQVCYSGQDGLICVKSVDHQKEFYVNFDWYNFKTDDFTEPPDAINADNVRIVYTPGNYYSYHLQIDIADGSTIHLMLFELSPLHTLATNWCIDWSMHDAPILN